MCSGTISLCNFTGGYEADNMKNLKQQPVQLATEPSTAERSCAMATHLISPFNPKPSNARLLSQLGKFLNCF